VEKAFDSCDSNGSGFIAIKRLKVVMRAIGFEPRQSEINQLILKMQENEPARQVSSDSFSLDELCYILEDKMASNDSNSEIHSAFELFDIKKKGYIDFADLKRIAKELGETDLEDKDFWEMIHIADFTKKGKITENDFKLIMQKTKMY